MYIYVGNLVYQQGLQTKELSCVAFGLPSLNVQSRCFVHVLFKKKKTAYSISAMQGLNHCCLV